MTNAAINYDAISSANSIGCAIAASPRVDTEPDVRGPQPRMMEGIGTARVS
jgi:hypothetical protein